MDFVYESHRISPPKNERKQIKYNFHDDAFILLMDSQFAHIFWISRANFLQLTNMQYEDFVTQMGVKKNKEQW